MQRAHPSLWQAGATVGDLNLPEDVDVDGVKGSAPPLTHQHTCMSHY